MLRSKILASPHVYRDYNLRLSVYGNPFVEGLRAALLCEEPDVSRRILSRHLKAFFANFQPSSVFEYLGLALGDAPGLANSQQPWTAPYPWADSSIEADLHAMSSALLSEAQRYGFNLSLSDGCSWCGPVSDEKIQLEVERYLSVAFSIRDTGFKIDHDWINAVQVLVLVDENGRYCFLLQDGAHRFAACAALGFKQIPYRVVGTIYKNEAALWPNVKSGLYTRSGAIRLFEMFMEAKQAYSLENSTSVTLASRSFTPVYIEKKNAESSGDATFETEYKENTSSIMQFHPVTGDVYYGPAAVNYEQNRKHSSFWQAEDNYMTAVLTSLSGVKSLLDVACGTGRFLPLYSKLGLDVSCFDSSSDMLQQARSKLNGLNKTKVSFFQGFADALPFSSSQFDLVVCFRFLSWIVTAEIAIKCIREISRVSSEFVILELCVNKMSPDIPLKMDETMWNKLTVESTCRLLAECGLDVLQTDELVDLTDHPGLTAFLCKKSRGA